MQTRKGSLFEITCNYVSGFVIAWLVWCYWAVPIMAICKELGLVEPTVGFIITALFTLVSVIRSYFWRRFFNHRLKG